MEVMACLTPTKRQLSAWADLKNRSTRDETGLFLAEGKKVVAEVQRADWEIEALLVREDLDAPEGSYQLGPEQMERVSGFRTPPDTLAVVRKPLSLAQPQWKPGTLALVLDGLQDPGNVGTLIRTAAWFGFEAVFASPDTADPFGPKAVQASMGALFHVRTGIIDDAWLADLAGRAPRMGTFLDGESLYEAKLPREGLIVLGNEGHGIRPAWSHQLDVRLTIPRFGPGAESLNVATAAAILMAEFRRQK